MNTNEQKRLRVGIIGLGAISNTHIRSLQMLSDIEICAICDINEKRLEDKKTTYALSCPTYTDYTEMIDKEHPDAVHVLTPHYLHAPMTVYALKHGVNVFLEKPMGISYEDIEQIQKAEEESGKRVCVCFQNRFNPATLLAKKAIEEDGGVTSAYATVIWNRDASYYASDAWRGRWETEGGGVMINQAIHTLDLLCQFLGKPLSLKATCQNHHLKEIIEVEDMCEGVVTFEGGVHSVFYATTAFEGGNVTTVYLKTKNHTIQLQNEALFIDNILQSFDENHLPYYGKMCYGKGHPELISRFYEALRSQGEMPVNTESSQYALRLLLSAYKSEGKEILI